MRKKSHTSRSFSPIQKMAAESPEILSEHLTYLELNQMDRITPDEIVKMVMAREQGGITLSNVNQYIQFSNRISTLGTGFIQSVYTSLNAVIKIEKSCF